VAECCYLCKAFKEIVYVDELDQSYCMDCFVTTPIPGDVWGRIFLLMTVPFQVGDKVKCSLYDRYEGIGHVDAVHFDLKHGGTPVYPTFHVVMDEKAFDEVPDDSLYTEVCLEKV
jgi:hypothetical protein